MARQQGRVVDDGAVLGLVDDLHGNKLRAERQDVELRSGPRVLGHHLGDGLTLHTPAGEFENRNAVLLCFGCCGTEFKGHLNRVRRVARVRGGGSGGSSHPGGQPFHPCLGW